MNLRAKVLIPFLLLAVAGLQAQNQPGQCTPGAVLYNNSGNALIYCGTDTMWHTVPLSTATVQTCDASTVADYAPAVCVFTLTSADLLQFDGTPATAVQIIAAPASVRVIVGDYNNVAQNLIFGTHPFSAGGNLFGTLGAIEGEVQFPGLGFNATESAVSLFPASSPDGLKGTVTALAGQPFSVYASAAINLGPIATWTLASGGITDGVNTSQITSGSEGTLWSNGDSFTLPCGATFLIDTTTGGAITTYHATAIGTGCTVGNAQDVTAVSGTGIGAKIDVLTVGGGYLSGDTWQDSYCNATDTPAEGHIDTVDANGIVTALTIDNPGVCGTTFAGNNPDALSNSGTQTGIGQGLSINITTITQGDGTVKLSIPYRVVPVQ